MSARCVYQEMEPHVTSIANSVLCERTRHWLWQVRRSCFLQEGNCALELHDIKCTASMHIWWKFRSSTYRRRFFRLVLRRKIHRTLNAIKLITSSVSHVVPLGLIKWLDKTKHENSPKRSSGPSSARSTLCKYSKSAVASGISGGRKGIFGRSLSNQDVVYYVQACPDSFLGVYIN